MEGKNCLEDRVLLAKENPEEMDQLLTEYQPFLKKQLSGKNGSGLEYDDMFSLAMLTFIGCIMQYEEGRGNFLSYCSICIKNRIIDEMRKQSRYTSHILLLDKSNEFTEPPELNIASIKAYNKELERAALSEEIEALSQILSTYGISFYELTNVCPRHSRSKTQCVSAAKILLADRKMKIKFFKSHKLPQKELAAKLNISPKTIEKHRKYIAALAILLSGDYPGIKAFLPACQEKKQIASQSKDTPSGEDENLNENGNYYGACQQESNCHDGRW